MALPEQKEDSDILQSRSSDAEESEEEQASSVELDADELAECLQDADVEMAEA